MADDRKGEWKTLLGIEIPESFSDSNTAGVPPYTSGIHETMYRSRLWTMRQHGFQVLKKPMRDLNYYSTEGKRVCL